MLNCVYHTARILQLAEFSHAVYAALAVQRMSCIFSFKVLCVERRRSLATGKEPSERAILGALLVFFGELGCAASGATAEERRRYTHNTPKEKCTHHTTELRRRCAPNSQRRMPPFLLDAFIKPVVLVSEKL